MNPNVIPSSLRMCTSFLSYDECCHLISKYDSKALQKSQTTSPGDPKAKSKTSSENRPLDNHDCDQLKYKVSECLNWSYQSIENPHFIRYRKGNEYKLHYDDFPPIMFYMKEVAEKNQLESRGNRVATAILYLNEDFKGGETEFPLTNYRIVPKTGLLASWHNINSDGIRIEHSMHAGLKILSGTKYIIGFHLREH